MKNRKKKKLTKHFKILFITILIVSSLIFLNKGKSEEYIANVENLKSNLKKGNIIDDIISVKQMPDYPTGCESISLYILLKHYKVDVTIDEIIRKLPKGSIPYEVDEELYGADPEKEFVGSPYNEYSFGVFEIPIKNVANKFKKGANSKTNASIKEVKEIIDSNNPLIAWTRIYENLTKLEYIDSWLSEDEEKLIKWPKGEHAVVVYGYDDEYYYISNPYNGEKYPIEKEIFEYNFKLLGSRIVYYK